MPCHLLPFHIFRGKSASYIFPLTRTQVKKGEKSGRVFKRYSDFVSLFSTLRMEFGKSLDNINLPKKYMFDTSSNARIIEKRRLILGQCMQQLLLKETIRDSLSFREFLELEEIIGDDVFDMDDLDGSDLDVSFCEKRPAMSFESDGNHVVALGRMRQCSNGSFDSWKEEDEKMVYNTNPMFEGIFNPQLNSTSNMGSETSGGVSGRDASSLSGMHNKTASSSPKMRAAAGSFDVPRGAGVLREGRGWSTTFSDDKTFATRSKNADNFSELEISLSTGNSVLMTATSKHRVSQLLNQLLSLLSIPQDERFRCVLRARVISHAIILVSSYVNSACLLMPLLLPNLLFTLDLALPSGTASHQTIETVSCFGILVMRMEIKISGYLLTEETAALCFQKRNGRNMFSSSILLLSIVSASSRRTNSLSVCLSKYDSLLFLP